MFFCTLSFSEGGYKNGDIRYTRPALLIFEGKKEWARERWPCLHFDEEHLPSKRFISFHASMYLSIRASSSARWLLLCIIKLMMNIWRESLRRRRRVVPCQGIVLHSVVFFQLPCALTLLAACFDFADVCVALYCLWSAGCDKSRWSDGQDIFLSSIFSSRCACFGSHLVLRELALKHLICRPIDGQRW